MSRRSPRETAQRDQALAWARDVGQEPGTLAVVVDYAAPGMACSWCDCPVSAHAAPNSRCSGCDQPAAYMVSFSYGRPDRLDAPVCKRHHASVAEEILRLLNQAGGQP